MKAKEQKGKKSLVSSNDKLFLRFYSKKGLDEFDKACKRWYEKTK